MKKTYFGFLLFMLIYFNSDAQNPQLWGMTSYGGLNSLGNIFKINTDGWGLETAYSFGTIPNQSSGGHPENDLYQASDGKLYGMTYDGGLYNKGTIFSFDINTNTFTRLYSFGGFDGTNPMGSVVEADNGKLYGMTSRGGALGYGAVFSFDISTNTYTTIFNFSSNTYPSAVGSFIKASNGKLYGMTEYDGIAHDGTIFSIDPATDTYTLLKPLVSINAYPRGSFYQVNDSILYAGFNNGIMKYNIVTNTVKVVNSNTNLAANLTRINDWLLIGNGNYYQILSFNLNDDSVNVVYQMPYINNNQNHYPDGSNISGTPLLAANGIVYGLANEGGLFNSGTLYSYSPINNTFNKLYDFEGVSAGSPMGGLIQASNGKLYGMTSMGGAGNAGVIFSFDPELNIYSKIFDFKGFYSADGSSPKGNLLHAGNGLLYGMTSMGGNNNVGALFSFDANSNSFNKLHDFDTAQGAEPNGSLIQASDGNLYGMTLLGGTDTNHYNEQLDFQYMSLNKFIIEGSGVIFKYNINTNTYTVLHYFNDSTGGVPYGNLIQSSNGKLYGMATYGGTYNEGVIFSYDLSTNTYQVIHSFNDTAGANPYGSLIEGTDGKLYGMTLNGGIYEPIAGRCGDFGVVFSLDTGTYNYTVLQYFNYGNNSGQRPFGSLLQATNGKLYGMTSGTSNGIYQVDYCTFGSGWNIFNIDISTNTFSTISNSGSWSVPYGSLIQSSNGKMYGMTAFDGTYGDGDIISIDTTTGGNYTILNNFYGPNGYYPYGDLIEMPQGTGINQINKSNTVYLNAFPNPFDNSTTFKIGGIAKGKNSMLNLYDITGRKVSSLFVGNKNEIIFNREGLENGIYLYKLMTNEREIIASGKLIIY